MKRAVGLLIGVLFAAACSSGGQIDPGTAPAPATGADAITKAPKKRMTRIVVYKDGNTCKATIDDATIYGKPRKPVAWMVEDEANQCYETTNWHIELQFMSDWNNGRDRIVKIDPDDTKTVKIHQSLKSMSLEYKVYLVIERFGDDVRLPVIDPELQIEM